MNDYIKQFGEHLSKLRRNRGLTQQNVADKLNVERTTISYYERGITSPNIETLKKLTLILNVDFNTMFDFK